MTQDAANKIIAFANQVGNPARDPVRKAQDRGWLCAEQKPTETGAALIEELDGQIGTRSTFR